MGAADILTRLDTSEWNSVLCYKLISNKVIVEDVEPDESEFREVHVERKALVIERILTYNTFDKAERME